jgi:hypothetical protein
MQHIRKAVGGNCAVTANTKLTVPTMHDTSRPEPTMIGLIHLCPKAIFGCHLFTFLWSVLRSALDSIAFDLIGFYPVIPPALGGYNAAFFY